ncbi:MAG: WYL domain-containing protein, partial [Phormidium sp.]
MPSGVDRDNYDPLDAVKKSIDSLTGKFAHVDYIVELPPRSLREFSWWVCRHMENAEVLEPDF